jgi:hypothetical protein
MSLRYRELGLELFSLGDDFSHQLKKPPMEREKRDDGERYIINMFLEEYLA